MSLPLQLRIYTLKSAEAAKRFVPHWKAVGASLQQFHNAKTLGVYTSPTSPEKVVAIVQFPAKSDPLEIMKQYSSSEQFKKDLEGFDRGEFVGLSGDVLEVVEF